MEKLYNNYRYNAKRAIELIEGSNQYIHTLLKKHLRREYKNRFLIPPKKFKAASGFNIEGYWNLGGMQKRDLQLLCYFYYLPDMWHVYFDIVRLNPQLKVIKSINEENLYDVLLGIASGFNLADILFFIGPYKKIRNYNYIQHKDPWITLRINLHKLDPITDWGHVIQWVMSPETCYKLIKKIEKLQASYIL